MKNGCRINLILVLIVLFCAFNISGVKASRYVKIAVIPEIPRINKNQEQQVIVNQVIDFWKNQLKQVLPNKPDLILLTEACDRPVGMSREEQLAYYKVRKDQVKEYFATVAKANHCYIVFGTKRQDKDGNLLNSSIVLDRNGREAGFYDKNFPTIGELESGIRAGDEVPVIQCDFGKVACVICYDLNFPELRLKYEKANPDIILFSSMYHGGLVQSYWAYSCRSFFVGSIGGKSAPSEVRDPLGEVVASNTNYFSSVVTKINLDCQLVHLDENWEKLAKLKEKYNDDVIIKDPGKLGAVLITSESKDITVDQMIKEFNIEKLDHYFSRSREVRLKNMYK